jgi:monoamine oxidase
VSAAGIHLSTPVERVVATDRGVSASAGSRTFQADLCVLTAPLPALLAVEIVPAPPAAIAAAIDEL